MTHHRPAHSSNPTPNWLKAWYAFLVFMAVITALGILVQHK